MIAVYVPANQGEMLRFFKARVLSELPRFRWDLFNRAVRAADYPGALDIAVQALDEEAERYGVMKAIKRRSSVHVTAPSRVPLYLASIFGRFDVIDRVIAIERFALDEAAQPYSGSEGEAGRARHERNAAFAVETHEARLAQALEHRDYHEHFGAILKTVRQRPGIFQAELIAEVPDRDTREVTRMVDQLEASGFLATKKVGNRVGVWPADHPGGPSDSERRTPRWSWAVDDYWQDRPVEWLDPARTIADIETLAGMVEATARQPGAGEGLRPTALDFIQGSKMHFVSPALTGGIPIHADPDQLALAFWGHQDLAESAAIAGRIIRAGGAETTVNQKKKWLLAEPRHTHMERLPFTERFGTRQPGWLLREVPGPTANSVPATSFVVPSACIDPEKAVQLEVACWLKRTRKRT